MTNYDKNLMQITQVQHRRTVPILRRAHKNVNNNGITTLNIFCIKLSVQRWFAKLLTMLRERFSILRRAWPPALAPSPSQLIWTFATIWYSWRSFVNTTFSSCLASICKYSARTWQTSASLRNTAFEKLRNADEISSSTTCVIDELVLRTVLPMSLWAFFSICSLNAHTRTCSVIFCN